MTKCICYFWLNILIMKNRLTYLSSLVAILLMTLSLNVCAQVHFKVTQVFFKNATTNFNSIDTLYVTVKNTGNASYTGLLFVNYKSDSMLTGAVLDSVSVTNMKPNDTVQLNQPSFMIQQPNFHKNGNIVVVWPVAGSIAGDSANTTVFVNPTGIAEMQNRNDELILFPNPANNTLYFLQAGLKNTIENVRIYDARGLLVKNIAGYVNKIELDSLTSGLYFVEIENSDHLRTFKRFVKE